MTKFRTAWLALLLLGSVSAVAAMFTGTWRAPAAADAMPDQATALAEPDDSQTRAINWPDVGIRQDVAARPDPEAAARQEMAARQVVDPDPMPAMRGSEPAASPFPVAPQTIAGARAIANANASANANVKMNLMSRHWHDANAATKLPMGTPQLKRVQDSKAELRTKRSKAAANTKTCAPPSNALASLFRKLSLVPSCTI